MRCSKVERELASYADDLLGSAQRRAINSHLAGCSSCRQALADVSTARAALHVLGPVRAPASFAPRVKAAARAEAARALRQPLLPWQTRTAMATGTLVAVGALLMSWYVTRPRLYVAPLTASLSAGDIGLGTVVAVAQALDTQRDEARAAYRRSVARAHARRPNPERRVTALVGPAPSEESPAPAGAETPPVGGTPSGAGIEPERSVEAPAPSAADGLAVAPRPVTTLAALDVRLLEASQGPIHSTPAALPVPAAETDVPSREVASTGHTGEPEERPAVYTGDPAAGADARVCFASLLRQEPLQSF